MVRNREEAARHAEASTSNIPGACQLWTRTQFDAPSVGDVDHDKDADAVDGWKSEPEAARHPGDRNPPRGVPVAWGGGSRGFGHRAVSLGRGKIRSSDAGGLGKVATVDLGWVEREWGLTYLGWSATISGQVIPLAPKKPTRVSEARKLLKAALELAKKEGNEKRRKRIRAALNKLPWR